MKRTLENMLLLEFSVPLFEAENSGFSPKIYTITDALHCDQCDNGHQKYADNQKITASH
jgi:hypothetical protein